MFDGAHFPMIKPIQEIYCNSLSEFFVTSKFPQSTEHTADYTRQRQTARDQPILLSEITWLYLGLGFMGVNEFV